MLFKVNYSLMSKYSISFTLAFLVNVLSAYSQDYEIQVIHNIMKTEIGQPAYISPGSNTPSFRITAHKNCSITGELILVEEDSVISTLNETILKQGESTTVIFQNFATKNGLYRANFKVRSGESGNAVYYESYYYTVLEARKIRRWNSLIVHPDANGQLRYVPDYLGNRIPDFSTAGYMGGGVQIPNAPVRIKLDPQEGDDTKRIQEAIDYISSLDPDSNGIRGALLLSKGIFEINSSINIRNGGVVIRGEGAGDYKKPWLDPASNSSLYGFKNSIRNIDATVIIATGSERRTLINVHGENGVMIIESSVADIIEEYVPVGARSFRVSNPERFNIGDEIIIQRIGNADWISAIGMDQIPQSPIEGSNPPVPWRPFNLNFERFITNIEENIITIEGSILNAIESKWGGGRIYKFHDERIFNVGIEKLRAISFWVPDDKVIDDTKHADRFLEFNNIKDAWIQDVALEHFYSLGGAINISRTSKQITIKNSSNLIADPKYYSGPGYGRERTNLETGVEVGRYGFYSEGQSNLVMGCYTMNNRRSFGVSSRVPGPNVFLDCYAENSLTTSEPHHRWSVGGLYDNVHDNIAFINRLYHGTGQGWAGANYVAWNTLGGLRIQQPPTAQNWSVGHKGIKMKNLFPDHEFDEGYWDMKGSYVLPRSLYIQQLKDRKGDDLFLNGYNNLMFKETPDEVKVWNFPNPADFFTIFVYVLEINSKVLLSIYSLTGKLLANIDFGHQIPGYHEVIWETTDDNGQPLNNGIYVYRFMINDQVYSNKLVINK